MVNRVLLRDLDLIEARPISRLSSVFSFRNGMYNTIERVSRSHPDSELYFEHPDVQYEQAICKAENLLSFKEADLDDSGFDLIVTSENLSPLLLLDKVSEQLESDLRASNSFNKKTISNITVVGNQSDLFIHETAEILPGVVFDTRDGVIVIDAETKVTPFSYLAGPLYIGNECRIDNAKVSGGCIVGNHVRLGGEVENSYINDFSNKHHEGFLGHSIVGSWVNIGAIATTSDLKNNYGEVRLKLPKSFIPSYEDLSDLEEVATGTIKFGSIIGDCVKIGIGTMINTGTVIDCGCNIFGTSPDKYMLPFSWGTIDNRYILDKFVKDSTKIFARRHMKPHGTYSIMASRMLKELG